MRHHTTQTLCACHDRPVADGATLCADGTDELRDLLRWLTTEVCRADREPDTETIKVKIPGEDTLVERVVIVRHGFGRRPSTVWDTPSGEVRNLPRVLDESAAKLAVRTGMVLGRTPHAEPPIPLDPRAVDDAGRIRLMVGTYASLLSGRSVPLDAYWDVPTVATWLIDELATIRQRDWAGRMLTDLRHVITRATRTVDTPPARHYLGVCGHKPTGAPEGTPPCPGQVFALEDSPRGSCNRCTALHDVQERRTQRFEQLHGVRLTAAEIERVTTELGRPVSRNTITKWHERGRITRDGGGRYLFDDALRLAEQSAARRSRPGSAA